MSSLGAGHRALLAVPFLFAALLLSASGARQVYLDLAYTGAATELSFWGSENYRPSDRTIERTGATLATILRQRPHHPDYLASQAYYLSWLGHFSADITRRLEYNQQAVATQYQAVMARPAYRQGWIEMIEYASRATGGAQRLAQAQTRLAALQPPQR
jgi:cytolysin (calcineurin-like family phosphatase)